MNDLELEKDKPEMPDVEDLLCYTYAKVVNVLQSNDNMV